MPRTTHACEASSTSPSRPRLVERMRSRVESLSDELLSRAVAAGRMELIHDYALPIPLTVISEMLGIPTQDQHRFHRWSNAIVASTAAPNLFRVLPAVWMLVRYLRGVIAAKRDRPQDDLISALVQAQEAGDRLRDDELVAMVFLFRGRARDDGEPDWERNVRATTVSGAAPPLPG